ncbi:Uma2 family endonuclease [Rhodopseudomonas palustris]|uniref:Putative restriction endonuclease domain-containing protein n=1 Tax=Rhodopseudomonas palustris (strain BisB18) TaxID=316056 RepID=Q20YH4_RHOPB
MGVAISDSALAGGMSVAEFRAFQDRRPDHERWELISGVPMMMTPATIAHNRIASNLEWLLTDALGRFDRSRLATQRPGIDLGSIAYRPEPDVGVIDADYAAGQRFVEHCYLLAEIVSETDELPVPGTGGRWIDVKREIYRAHPPCEAVLIVEQDRIEVAVDIRSKDGWRAALLNGPEAELRLPAFGLRCALAALYEGTPLMPRRERGGETK